MTNNITPPPLTREVTGSASPEPAAPAAPPSAPPALTRATTLADDSFFAGAPPAHISAAPPAPPAPPTLPRVPTAQKRGISMLESQLEKDCDPWSKLTLFNAVKDGFKTFSQADASQLLKTTNSSGDSYFERVVAYLGSACDQGTQYPDVAAIPRQTASPGDKNYALRTWLEALVSRDQADNALLEEVRDVQERLARCPKRTFYSEFRG